MTSVFKKFGILCLIITAFFLLNGAFGKDATNKTAQETLKSIDKYQAQYFTIVKRNDYFLNLEDDKSYKKDKKELKKLYKKVEKQITNKPYIQKYKSIEKRYAECSEETTTGMNEFAQNHYNEVDKLLNDVYKDVKSKISSEDFKNLTISERKWLKEVNDYEKIFDSMGFGTIGTIVYYTYQIDMRQFRTLLLMLYL